jgi:hypothetical protein
VADLYRRAQISRAANDRYLTALAAASITTPLAQEAVKVCRPVRRELRRHRALNPFETADAQLLAAVNRGEWALKGFPRTCVSFGCGLPGLGTGKVPYPWNLSSWFFSNAFTVT